MKLVGLEMGYFPDRFELVESAARACETLAPPPASEGAKDDRGKSRIDLIPNGLMRCIVRVYEQCGDKLPGRALLQIGQVLDYGARLAPRPDGTKGYGEDNWQGVANGKVRYIAAAMRHIAKHAVGELFDEESQLPHLAHAATCVMFVCWLENAHEGEAFSGFENVGYRATETDLFRELLDYRQDGDLDALAQVLVSLLDVLNDERVPAKAA